MAEVVLFLTLTTLLLYELTEIVPSYLVPTLFGRFPRGGGAGTGKGPEEGGNLEREAPILRF